MIIFSDYIVYLVITFAENIVYLVNNMIYRLLYERMEERFFNGKAIILLGPRQVGKTTLIKSLLENKPHLFLNGDDPYVRNLLENADSFTLKEILGTHNLIFLNEAQRIPNIGLTLKILTDQFPQIQVLVSGSSALELNDKTQEPLTGRKWEYKMFPISWEEFERHVGFIEAEQQLEHRLVFGMYPEVVMHPADAQTILEQLANSYLYKDVLALTGIRKPDLLERLLKALALQLGNEVSYTELAELLGVDKSTVMKYIDLLEKAFVVFTLSSFSRNQRNEIKNNRKIYFYDTGIRNVIIHNLNSLSLRNDTGALWENFLIAERMKKQAYHQQSANRYFWRTVQKQEIDYVEESGGALHAFEFKWKNGTKAKVPKSFLETYKAQGTIIDRSNFREFVR